MIYERRILNLNEIVIVIDDFLYDLERNIIDVLICIFIFIVFIIFRCLLFYLVYK